jgi:magnesium transporter
MKTYQQKYGAPPGSLIYVGPKQHVSSKITCISFNENEILEASYSDFESCNASLLKNHINWINIEGVDNVKLIDAIGIAYKLHPLTLEDILHLEQRPKCEDYEHYLMATLKMLRYTSTIESEQVTLILLQNTIITFQQPDNGDAFEVIRNRLKAAKGRVRKMGADYLFYALMDAIVDWYFHVIEALADRIAKIEEKIMEEQEHKDLMELYRIKRELIFLRKQVWPLRDMISALNREPHALIAESSTLYFRDLLDHSTRIIDSVESQRDLIAGLMDVHLSSNSNRMNEVMKTLTILSSVFIPVTFIAGVYGMNFKDMPGLYKPYGFAIIWGLMLVIMGGLLFYFKRKKWF